VVSASDCGVRRTKVLISPRTAVFIANANVICSLGHGLRTFTAALQHCEVSSALHPSRVAKSSTSSGWSKSGNVTSDGWQVTLCDPIWHVSSRSGVAMLHCELLYRTLHLTYTSCR